MLADLTHLLSQNNPQLVIDFIKNILRDEHQTKRLKETIPMVILHPSPDKNIFHYAIQVGSKELINLLTENKLIPESFYNKKFEGASPLMLAVQHKNYDFVENELKNGGDVNDQNEFNKRHLLDEASLNCDPKMVELLLRYKANLKLQNPLQLALTAHRARESNRTKVVNLLIAHGINVLTKIGEKEQLYTEFFKGKPFEAEIFSMLDKEIKERSLFRKNACLLFWASKNDSQSVVYNANKDCIKQITASTYHS